MNELRIGRVRTTPVQRLLPGWGIFAVAFFVFILAVLPGFRSLLTSSLERVIAPVQWGTAQLLLSAGNLFGTVTQAGELSAQNRAYQEEIQRLQVTVAQMQELQHENRD